jgi:YebC/PmpR family DNA-binding regulatory protein
MSGHSRWANIKHKKAKSDAKRGKLWSKCARAIIVAAKNGGGDPNANLTLRYAIDDAKAANMPRDTIDNAVKKGTGELGAQTYESIVYEGYGPSGVAVLLEILTDNRNRTASEVRKIFEKGGGNLGATGCVGYLFQTKAQLTVNKTLAAETGRGRHATAAVTLSEDALMEAALDAGLEEIQDGDDAWLLYCDPANLQGVRDALEAAHITVESATLTRVPTTTVTLAGESAQKVINLVETLEDNDDVQKVYANFDIPDEALADLA